jgi:hypothetical protein
MVTNVLATTIHTTSTIKNMLLTPAAPAEIAPRCLGLHRRQKNKVYNPVFRERKQN